MPRRTLLFAVAGTLISLRAWGQLPLPQSAPHEPPTPDAGARSLLDGPTQSLSVNITAPAGLMPADPAQEAFAAYGKRTAPPLEDRQAPLRYRHTNAALNACHHALFFEQPALERYGCERTCCPTLASAAHFFGTIPTLPYQFALRRPHQHVALGGERHDRGSKRHRCAAVAQAVVSVGLAFVIP